MSFRFFHRTIYDTYNIAQKHVCRLIISLEDKKLNELRIGNSSDKMEGKNVEDPLGGKPSHVPYTISSFLPSYRRLRPSVVMPFRWTPTPTIYLINSMRCPLPFDKKKKRCLHYRRYEDGIRKWGESALVPWLPLLNPRMEKNDSNEKV